MKNEGLSIKYNIIQTKCGKYKGIFYEVLAVPQNIVLDLNSFMEALIICENSHLWCTLETSIGDLQTCKMRVGWDEINHKVIEDKFLPCLLTWVWRIPSFCTCLWTHGHAAQRYVGLKWSPILAIHLNLSAMRQDSYMGWLYVL